MTRKSPRELEHDIENLGGGRRRGHPPGDPAERYDRYRADAGDRWDRDGYADRDDHLSPGDGGPVLRLWDAYALAYDDPRAWDAAIDEVVNIMIAEDPRPPHLPPAPDGYDGALPVPTENVRDAIAGLEAAYDVKVKRLTDRDTVADLPEAVDPDLLDGELNRPEFAGLIAMTHEAF